MQLGQVAQSHSERLGVVLLDPEVDRLQTAHVEEQLGLLQSHGAARHTGHTGPGTREGLLMHTLSEWCTFTATLVVFRFRLVLSGTSDVRNVIRSIKTGSSHRAGLM